MKKIAVIVLAFLSCLFQAEARSSGAPNSACSNLTPRHAPNEAGNDPFPYEVDLSMLAMSGYDGGKNYSIQLKGTPRDRNFRGFLIQARTVGDDSPVGSFNSGTLHQQVCTNNTAATHINGGQKTEVTLQWIAPAAGTGPIKFWYSFVDIHRRPRSRFWAREMSIVINEAICPVKGQVQKNCTADPSCATTCANRFFFRICPLVCALNGSGCECPEGTIIDEDQNECVTPDKCPEIPCPGEGQSFSSNCRPLNATCNNPFPPVICDAPMCSCPIGQALDEETNKCVNVSECKNCTIKGQILQQCGIDPRCATTCTNRFNFRACSMVCNGVCECPTGTIIDEGSNECVPPSECPEIPCPGKGQSFVGGCNPFNATCSNPNPGILCDVGFCACPFGQVLDEITNTCVNVSECPTCPVKGQVRKNCTADPSCATTCANRFFFRICPLVCALNGSGCECPEGTIIDEDRNECVTADKCPEIPCPGEGQSFSSNCRPINATCNNPFPPIICDAPMCSCPIGQALDEETNKCINASECRNCTVKGQILKQCGMDPRCATTCTNRFDFRACFEVCSGVCECPAGTIIDEDSNECVPPSECPEIPCPGKGQSFVGGCNPFNATCSNPNPGILCDVGFCACPSGQVLDEFTNTCVNVSQCALCSIKGQIHTADCFGINATCSNPNPPMICDFPQCVCPRGQVIDEVSNACINGTECRRGCNIRRISGSVNYNNNRRRLTLRFSPNRQGQEAFFQCQIDDQRFRACTSPKVWRNLNLRRGRHTVTVRGSCTYNGGVTSTSSRSYSFRVRNRS